MTDNISEKAFTEFDSGRIEDIGEFLSPEELYSDVIERVRRYHPSDDISLIEKGYEVARKAAVTAVGQADVIDAQPTMASEDFSLIMDRIPSFFYWIGSGTPGEVPQAWHSEAFHTDDRGIRIAALTMACAAAEVLG